MKLLPLALALSLSAQTIKDRPTVCADFPKAHPTCGTNHVPCVASYLVVDEVDDDPYYSNQGRGLRVCVGSAFAKDNPNWSSLEYEALEKKVDAWWKARTAVANGGTKVGAITTPAGLNWSAVEEVTHSAIGITKVATLFDGPNMYVGQAQLRGVNQWEVFVRFY